MKSAMCIIVAFLFITANLFSQQKFGAELSEIRKQRNQIDLDIKRIFSGLSNATLLYKRTYQTGNLIEVNAIKLIRFGASMNTQINFDKENVNQTDSSELVYYPVDLIDFTLNLGWEKQIMHKNFVHYFGFDAVFHYREYNDGFFGYWNNQPQPNPVIITAYGRAFNQYEAGVNPFFGIKFYLNERISLGIETGVSLLYFNEKTTLLKLERGWDGEEFVNRFSEGESVTTNGIRTHFNNLRFLTVGYTF